MADLGEKRTCPHCGAKFYDLGKSPASCPKCKTEFDPVSEIAKPKRTREKVKPAPADDDDDEVEDDEVESDDEDEEEDEEEIVALDAEEPELVAEDDTAEPGVTPEPKASKRKASSKFTPDDEEDDVEDEIEDEDDGLTVIDEDDEFEDDDIELEGDGDED